jgi:hypothetical protein
MEMVAVGTDIPAAVSVLALGMAKNSSVVSVEKATIMGVDGTSLQLDNTYLQSAPGGPVIHAISGKVLGVVGKVIAKPKGLWQNNESYTGEPQQFVTRLNKEMVWKETKIGSFIAESKRLREFDNATRLACAVASVQLMDNTPSFDSMIDGSHASVQSVFEQNKETSLVQSLEKWKVEGSGKKLSMSVADVKKRWRGILSEALSLAQRGVPEMKAETFSWYHRAHAEASLGARKDAIEDLNEKMAEAK